MTVEARKYDMKPLAAATEFQTTKEIPANGEPGAEICGFRGWITAMISVKSIWKS